MKYRFLALSLLIITILFVFLTANAENMECVLTTVTADPDVIEAIPAISDDDHVLGRENETMSIIVYGDFRCGNSAKAVLNLMELQNKHPEDIRLVFRLFPRENHVGSRLFGYALEASARQNLAFETISILYKYEDSLWSIRDESGMLSFCNKTLLPELKNDGLDAAKWQRDFYDSSIRKRVGNLRSEGLQTGYISGTPVIFVNDTLYNGSRDADVLENLYRMIKAQALGFDSCPDIVTEHGKSYSAILNTTKGDVEIELFVDKAPLAVNSFVFLANNGWYNDSPFFSPGKDGFVLQSGDPNANGIADAGYSYPFEASQITPDQPGMVGMVTNAGGQNDSRFFITYNLKDYYQNRFEKLSSYIANLSMDAEVFSADMIENIGDKYTFFGQVTEETLPILNSLTADDRINTVTVITSESK